MVGITHFSRGRERKEGREKTIVLRPGLIQGLGSGFWPGHLVGRVIFFLKSKWRRFSKKNKSQRVCNRVAGSTHWVSRATPGFSFPRFFFNPARFQPRVNPLGRAGFQNYGKNFNCCLTIMRSLTCAALIDSPPRASSAKTTITSLWPLCGTVLQPKSHGLLPHMPITFLFSFLLI